MDISLPIRHMMKALPIKVPLSGIKRNTILAVLDIICPKPSSLYNLKNSKHDDLLISHSNPNERLLKYAFWNVKRYFIHSELAALIREEIPINRLFVDIGANLGFYSLLAKEAGIQAVSFEPEPQHADYLKRNAHVFPHVFDIALSDENGTAVFNVGSDKNQGCSSLINSSSGRNAYYYNGTVDVTTNTFDHFLQEHKEIIPADIAGIKIDVEGAECKTLAGMTSFLKHSKAWIWSEVRGESSDRGSNSYKHVLSIANENNYKAYCYTNNGLEEFNEEQHVKQLFDMLFLKPDIHADLIKRHTAH